MISGFIIVFKYKFGHIFITHFTFAERNKPNIQESILRPPNLLMEIIQQIIKKSFIFRYLEWDD